MNKLYKLPPDFCCQVVWESRRNHYYGDRHNRYECNVSVAWCGADLQKLNLTSSALFANIVKSGKFAGI